MVADNKTPDPDVLGMLREVSWLLNEARKRLSTSRALLRMAHERGRELPKSSILHDKIVVAILRSGTAIDNTDRAAQQILSKLKKYKTPTTASQQED